MGVKITNNAAGTLASSVSASGTSFTLGAGQGDLFPVLGAGDYTYLTLKDGSTTEVIKVTARSGDVFTCEALTNGYSAGAIVEMRVTKEMFDDLIAAVGIGVYEPIDATILRQANIGVLVQAFDADTLKADVTANLSVGFTTDIEVLGNNTITPDFQTEGLKSRAVNGNVTINPPTTGNGAAYIKLAADASGPYTVTLAAGVTPLGTIPDLQASTTYIAIIMRFGSSDAYCQIVEAG